MCTYITYIRKHINTIHTPRGVITISLNCHAPLISILEAKLWQSVNFLGSSVFQSEKIVHGKRNRDREQRNELAFNPKSPRSNNYSHEIETQQSTDTQPPVL
ncbi:hypothetical protein KQX54_021036 [Cotesia glomerata]|uniref:Uncharacterized protein n=1 Tax=Cotesia glomerata TaxID=32391 RepID=A0AAV7J8X1_COTGL|nr:hypothetical protein KQX54_021036 [Cotesia glomerata]